MPKGPYEGSNVGIDLSDPTNPNLHYFANKPALGILGGPELAWKSNNKSKVTIRIED